jgi:hypothetical protein
MDFNERLKKFLEEKEEEMKPNEPDKVNKDPESMVKPEESLKIPENIKSLQQFFTLVNPLRGEVKRCALFKYVKEFRQRGKDVLILKGKTSDKTMPFFSVNRAELTAFLASIMDDEEAMKKFSDQIETIYTTEETELRPGDYIDFVIKNKISIMSNPAEESFGVESQSDSVPTINTSKNQAELSVDPQKVEDSEGLNKSQKEEK